MEFLMVLYRDHPAP